ncbi:MAG: glycerate kinase [Bacteroidota bacterium]
MKYLLAPNAMKGALTAQKIATILSKTIRRKDPSAEIIMAPIADGGNGTLECLMDALGGTIYEREVTGPIPTIKVKARYGITRQNRAIIESAEAIGLHLLTPTPETIAASTSRGIGELLSAVMEHSCTEIWIGLGGTATNDGGAGAGAALGFSLLDQHGDPLRDGSIPLLQLNRILPPTSNNQHCPITILSDVQNPLLGESGATYTFARQKGASDDQLPYLESALHHFAETVRSDLQKDFSTAPGSGAAGGLAYELMTFCNATLVSGIDHILDATDFETEITECDLIVTTEGMLDGQTLFGKGIAGIARRAQQFQKPVHAFVGRINGDADELRTALQLASLTQISPEELTTPEAMRDASWLLADAVFHHHF